MPDKENEEVIVETIDDKPIEIVIEEPKATEPEVSKEAEPELPLGQPVVAAVPNEPAAPEPPAKQVDKGPDPVAELQQQLARMRAQAEAERVARAEAERIADVATTEVYRSRLGQADAQLHAIVNAISAEKNEAEIAEQAYAKAAAEADWDAAAKAQRLISRCEARLASLEDGKAQLEAWIQNPQRKAEGKRTAPRATPQQPAIAPDATGDPIDEYIAKQSPRVQTYLKSRDRNWLADPKQSQKLAAAHYTALAEGYAEESNGYFAFIDEKMGLKTDMKTEKKEPPRAAKPAIPAAPATQKSATSGGVNGMRVTLTPGQKKAAEDMGIPLAEYAKRVWMMQQPGWNGPKFGGN